MEEITLGMILKHVDGHKRVVEIRKPKAFTQPCSNTGEITQGAARDKTTIKELLDKIRRGYLSIVKP